MQNLESIVTGVSKPLVTKKGKKIYLMMRYYLNLKVKNFRAAYQFAFVAGHYSDASNAERVANATRGFIPSYQVQDLSLSYSWRRFRFQSGINNLGNSVYFTRRAAAYPGPGIIPADARSFYGTFSIKL